MLVKGIFETKRNAFKMIMELKRIISSIRVRMCSHGKRVSYPILLFIFSFNIGVFNPAVSYSQSDSLLKYLELAAANNPAVLQKYSEYQAALQKIPQVGSLPDPEFTLGIFLKPMELIMGNQTADIKLMQMFPWFGTLKAAKDEMSLMAMAKFESFRGAKHQVFYDVRKTWYDLYEITQDLQISERNLQILNTIERLAIVRFRTAGLTGGGTGSSGNVSASMNQQQSMPVNSGGMQGMNSGQNVTNSTAPSSSSGMKGATMGSTSGGSGLPDLYRIQIEKGDLTNDIELLKNRHASVVARFNTFLNRPLDSPVAVADTLKPDSLETAMASVPDSILKNNPMIAMLNYEQLSLDARKRMVTRMGYPMVGLGVDYSMIAKSEMVTAPNNGKDMIMPMVSLTLPIYRKKYRAMQSESEILGASTALNNVATSNNLQAEYYQASELYYDAQRRIKLYSEQNQLAGKTFDIMIRSFSAAGSNLTDLLIIRQQILDYQLKEVEAVTDFNTAIAWLRLLMAKTQN